MRKKSPLFRSTALDEMNIDNVNVAPGSYELSKVNMILFSLLTIKIDIVVYIPSIKQKEQHLYLNYLQVLAIIPQSQYFMILLQGSNHYRR